MRTHRASSHVVRVARHPALAIALIFLLSPSARADYRLGWHTIGAGAGRSTGQIVQRGSTTTYGIAGSVGQALPGHAAGGGYALQAGFWTAAGASYLVAVPSPGTSLPAGADVLRAPQPNPFVGRTELTFDLARPGRVELRIFDTAGRSVRTLADGWYGAGSHPLVWDGTREDRSPAPTGLYFARFVSPATRSTRRLVLVR